MAQAIVDPAEIRRFAHQLKQFNEDLRDKLAVLHGQLIGLGDSWRDQEHERFTQEFEQTMHVLEAFMAAADQHTPFLLRKAERVEEYLQQK
ncbi:MAG: WXG100 family type VII secretion target [Gemmataceae bacterium]|nr:WXG100 family type VII secretion target [Gemmataceae bacterium]MCI0741128.1 WXG100 family type VII secretion target [Gemmataceae bacterium]